MLILNNLLTGIYRIEFALFSRLSVWKVPKSEPFMSLGYGYGTAGATDK